MVGMELKQEMGSSPSGSEERRRSFKIQIEDENNKIIEVSVYFVTKSDLYEGQIGEAREEGIFLRNGTPPILTPILARMFYFLSKGYSKTATESAAILYGKKMLDAPDLDALATLLGVQSTGIVLASEHERDTRYYADSLSRYLRNYESNGWVSRGRVCANLASQEGGVFTEFAIRFGGRGVIIANQILNEGAITKKDESGNIKVIAPPLRELLPEIISALDKFVSSLEATPKKRGRVKTELTTTDPLLERVLYLFSDEFASGSPFHFNRGAGAEKSVFDTRCISLLKVVAKQLRVEVNHEYTHISRVLAAAEKKYAALLDEGQVVGFKALLDSPQETTGKGLTPAEKDDIRGAFGQVSGAKASLAHALAGKGRLRTGHG